MKRQAVTERISGEKDLSTKMRIMCAVSMLAVLYIGSSNSGAETGGQRIERAKDPLAQTFLHPTEEAKPWVYWYWNNGNYTKEGVTADLESMKRVGLSGCTLLITEMMVPKGPVKFGTPEWNDVMMHAIREAGRLGMRLSIMNCEGWSCAGGPWIKPEMGMKKLVSSSMKLSGGEANVVLAQPQTTLNFYRDVTVLAYPVVPYGRLNGKEDLAKVEANWTPDWDPKQNGVDALFDNNPSTNLRINESKEPRQVTMVLKEPRTARAFTVSWNGWTMPSTVKLEASEDGKTYRTVVDEVSKDIVVQVMMPVNSRTFAFPEVTAAYWRMTFTCVSGGATCIVEAELTGQPRLANRELKAAFLGSHNWGVSEKFTSNIANTGPVEPLPPKESLVPGSKVLNISQYMDATGRLQWKVPEGDWVVLRVGYTATGENIVPATLEGRGLECDKFDANALNFQFEQMVAKLAKQSGKLAGSAYEGVWIDSWEAHGQNWTDRFPEEFKKRRGYDLIPYLPVITLGQVIETPDVCERVLWDFRRTMAELIRENFYRSARVWLNKRGMLLSGEFAGQMGHLYDPLNYMMEADVPVGEFWSLENAGGGQDVRAAASLAHALGQPTVGGEAYTGGSGYNKSPYQLKLLGDEAFCAGVNRFVVHTFAHQPWLDPKPGMSFGLWGIDFHRGNTWWEQGRQWVSYVSRCQQLLREGRFVADICHYIGDDVPNFVGRRDAVWKPIPNGRDFDCINTELLQQFKVKDRRLVLPSGMSYRVLLLPNREGMLPKSLEIVESLVREGATVVGPPPTRSPSLQGYPETDQKVKRIARQMWGQEAFNARRSDVTAQPEVNRPLGKGRVICGKSWTEVFDILGESKEDFTAVTSNPKANLRWIHRRTDDADIYFVSSPEAKPMEAICEFRVRGRQPEFWNPDTGAMHKTAVYAEADGVTRVPIRFDPTGSLFVVFRGKPAPHVVAMTRDGRSVFEPQLQQPAPLPETWLGASGDIVVKSEAPGVYELKLANNATLSAVFEKAADTVSVKGPWKVSFQPGRGAPAEVSLESLVDLSQHADSGVKYFSGKACYAAGFELPADVAQAKRKISLDLGDVQVIATVFLNGKDLGIVWKSPFELDVSNAIVPGRNELAVEVSNLWVNRLIGDEQYSDDCEWKPFGPYGNAFTMTQWPDWFVKNQPRPTQRVTMFPFKSYIAGSKLVKSGLLGPVTLKLIEQRSVSSTPAN